MRLTLEQLKAMSDADLGLRWKGSRFPFEMVDCCRTCLTMHSTNPCAYHKQMNDNTAHLEQTYRPMRLRPNSDATIGQLLRENLEELYALRLFYDSLYSPCARDAEATPESAEAVAESAAHTEVVPTDLP